jgi:hypothetical protein
MHVDNEHVQLLSSDPRLIRLNQVHPVLRSRRRHPMIVAILALKHYTPTYLLNCVQRRSGVYFGSPKIG